MTSASGDERLPQALLELDAITRRLRRDCPWDREQDERSIVPHTVEEAYELADAAHSGDDAKLLDELGDVLFQVYFLALLLEERGARRPRRRWRQERARSWCAATRTSSATRALADLPTDATHAVGGEAELGRDQAREGARPREPAEGLPALTFARKRLQARVHPAPGSRRRAGARRASPRGRVARPHHGSPELYEAVGELLLAVVALAGELRVDPEIALRRAVAA